MSIQATARWNWINGFLTASLHASIEYLSLNIATLNFCDFITKYLRKVQTGLQSLRLPTSKFLEEDLKYVFHLESELWGADYLYYTTFFPDGPSEVDSLQTFKFVLAFFTIERCLHLFLPQSVRQKGRGGKRQYLFGYKNGLFSVRYIPVLAVMGPPFYLSANRQTVVAVGASGSAWTSLKGTTIPPKLAAFYRKISGGRYEHFSSILESAFLNTRKTHLVRAFKKKNKPLPRGTRAWWYDVLWKYSESIRYHPLFPSRQSLSQPFFWNRSIRWFTSLAITGLLQILAISNPVVKQTWRKMVSSNRILSEVFQGCTRF